ncbi:MAG: gstA1 [Rhizobacter sp.]|nr:gstA1 [Rhizobacter sp.]
MSSPSKVTLYHSPQSRSTAALILFEELGVDYELHPLNMRAGDTRAPEFLAVNPMGKVPAILHNGALITEQAAVFMYLADLYPDRRLAPPIGHPLRGPYLRWMVFYGSCVEPALVDRALKREGAPPSMLPYGDVDTTIRTFTNQLAKGPYILGDTFTAADVLWGAALTWLSAFKLLPAHPDIKAYIDRFARRPATVSGRAKDAALMASMMASA